MGLASEVVDRGSRTLREIHASFLVSHDVAQPLERFAFEGVRQDFAFRSENTHPWRHVSLYRNEAPSGVDRDPTCFVGVLQVKCDFSILVKPADAVAPLLW